MNRPMKKLSLRLILSSAFVAALIVPAATAAHAAPEVLGYLCDGNGACLINEGAGQQVHTGATGTGWTYEYSGYVWDFGGKAYDVYYIVNGSGLCAEDAAGGYVTTGSCTGEGTDPLFYPAASGAIVSEETSQEEGHLYCLTVSDKPGGLIGNVHCPAGTPPASENFTWTAA
jgi:hypothetical protein